MKEIITSPNAPKAIGPYSQAVRANGLLFLSGQIPMDPGTNEVITGDIQAQTERVLENIKGVLESVGLSIHAVVKTTVFLKDMGEFTQMNEVYARYFGANSPARSTVEVARLPRDVSVEIEVIAVDKASGGSGEEQQKQ